MVEGLTTFWMKSVEAFWSARRDYMIWKKYLASFLGWRSLSTDRLEIFEGEDAVMVSTSTRHRGWEDRGWS